MDEKIGQLAQGAGGMLFVDPLQPALAIAERMRESGERLRTGSRLGIPALVGCEALHGVVLRPCTIYPQAIGLAATWDPALVKEMAAQIAREASAIGITQVLAPVLDLGRDPRFGRIEETYGECPTLASRMGVAYVTGAQGENAQDGLARDKVYCTAKHFAGYSVPANGINIAPVLVGQREMRTLHLIPFWAAVTQAHAMAVMPSYNAVDSVPSHANRWLLTEVLRDEWGFQGYVYSDWGGINFLVGHRVAANDAEAGLLAIQSGVDMEAPVMRCYRSLPGFVQGGRLAAATVDRAVSRVLRAKFLAGLFDGRRSDGDPALIAREVHAPDHVATSRRLAQEGIILLKNEGHLLPLDAARLRSIAVIGPNADQVEFGDYSWTKANRDGVNFLQALRSRSAGRVAIHHAKGCDLAGVSTGGFASAVQAAKESDVAVVVIGDTGMVTAGAVWEDPTLPAYGTAGEGFDVTNPMPPGVQVDLVKAIVATGRPTIVVLLNGRPYCLPWMHDFVPAIVEAFYPGEQQGNAIVDILFGNVNPSGRLPVTLCRSAGHIPCTYDFKPYGRGYYHKPGAPDRPGRDYVFDSPAPLWPFGFGLSYSTFTYSDLAVVSATVAGAGGVLRFGFRVTNTGRVAGKVVPQVYWRDLVAPITPPEKRLLCFDKFELQPGESRTITHEVQAGEFRSLTPDLSWVNEPREIELQVGDNAEDIVQSIRFNVSRQ